MREPRDWLLLFRSGTFQFKLITKLTVMYRDRDPAMRKQLYALCRLVGL